MASATDGGVGAHRAKFVAHVFTRANWAAERAVKKNTGGNWQKKDGVYLSLKND